MSFTPHKDQPTQVESNELAELVAEIESGETLTKLEDDSSPRALEDAAQSNTVELETETEPNGGIQYRTRRERREAERAAEAQARVEAFSESLRAAKAANVVSSSTAEESDEVEIPESFRAQWRSTRRSSGLFAGRRVKGSTVAIGLMAGTVVLGTGSAAAFAAVSAPEISEAADTEAASETAVETATEEVAAEESAPADAQTASETKPEIEETTVASFDSSAVAGLAAENETVVEEEATTASAPSEASTASAAVASVVWPVGEGSGISSGYGPRNSPTAGASSYHQGVDFVPGYGVAVGSMADGTVTNVSYGGTSYGNYIEVQHTIDGQTVTTLYAHLSAINVSVGQTVSAGETIGNVGNTGVSTGAHLHFEVIVGGSKIDPIPFLNQHA
ncbi:MAG: M23 family metallopeptidase [Gulosibacter sp.]|uniref:M23 family metallopeptidase n=1 Tax=Gulosibacter sp. TaxID=2817531 RepID=UPI003F8FF6BA